LFFEAPSFHSGLIFGIFGSTLEVFGVASCMTASSSSNSFGFIRCHLIIRVVDSAPSNYFLWASSAVLLFELWILLPQIISFGPAAPFYYSSCGFCSLELSPLGQQRRLIIQVVDSGPSNHFFSASSTAILFK
jgi:hypothetical protein